MNDEFEGREVQPMSVDSSTASLLTKAEIDQQIVTAHRFPRSLKRFRDEALAMVTLNEEIADECIYALPRDGKTIEGPSARFAEIVNHAWGNSRSGARIVDEGQEFVTAQGVCHDLEKNTAITFEVQRRIVDKHGKRFKLDMIGVTANAASSIALRNAILKVVPKAFWSPIYEAARRTVMGDFKTLENRRAAALEQFQKFGVTPERIFDKLGVSGKEDITLEHMVTLRGLLTAIRDGDTSVEDAFAKGGDPVKGPTPKKPAEDPGKAQPEQENSPPQESQSAQASATPSPQAPEAGESTALSDGQIAQLTALMGKAALTGLDVKAKFGKPLNELPASTFTAVKAWIKNPAPEGL